MSRRPTRCVAVALLGTVLAAPAGAVEPGVAGYQKLLDDYLHVISGPGEPIETRFDYLRLDGLPGYHERMGRIRRALLAVPPDSMSARERLAWAINLYNFRVIELVMRDLRDPRTKQLIPGVREIAFFHGVDFFEQPGLQVGDSSYTLNAFERRFLFADFDRASPAPPPRELDPRVHFAIVCAAVGCPPLLPRAYRADSLDAQLDFAVRNALANPRHLRWMAAEGRLFTSQLFGWYRRDFEPEGPLAFILRYAPAAVARSLRERGVKDLDQEIPWDWSLNRYVPGAR